MSPIQPTSSTGGGYSGPRPKLVHRVSSIQVPVTPSETDPPHSLVHTPVETSFPLPTTPTKQTSVKTSPTSPFKLSSHSPSRVARLLERSSKRGDSREGLFSRFERNEPGLQYLNQTNALQQATSDSINKKRKAEETKKAEASDDITAPAQGRLTTQSTTSDVTNPFSEILQRAREDIGITTNPISTQDQEYKAVLLDSKELDAIERKKSAAKKQSQLLEASLKAPRPGLPEEVSFNSHIHSTYAEIRRGAMADPQHFHHALLRPCIIQILRAAGYHASKPSVVDALTDLAAKHLMTMATRTVNYAALMRNSTIVDVPDVRMAMQDLGAFIPTMMIEDEILLPEGEDIRGVENFLDWATGPANREIRRVALDGVGEGGGVDFLTALMRKHDNAEGSDGTSRWDGTVLGKMLPPRETIIEGGEITSIKEWNKENVRRRWANANANTNGNMVGDDNKENEKENENGKDKMTNSTRQSSELSDLVEGDVEDVEMGGS